MYHGSVVWRERAPNSPDAARPILITMGKEDKELLGKIVPPVDAEMESYMLHKNGVVIEDKEERYELKVQFLRSMNDGKMQKTAGWKRWSILYSLFFFSS